MAVLVKDKVTGWIIGEVVVANKEELRKIERDFVVIPQKKEVK